MTSSPKPATKTSPLLLAYLRLFRVPNVFTALADVVMGFVFVQQALQPVSQFALLTVGSGLLYTAGMVLNDLFDVDIDRQQRPQRPLPSGAVTIRQAQLLGWGMLLLGVALTWLAGTRSGIVGSALALAIVLYDGVLKQTFLAPFVMGSCRMLNVLLGMSCSVAATFPVIDQWWVAFSIGLYIVGVTWFARSEALASQRKLLVFGLSLMVGSWVLLSYLPWLQPAATERHAILAVLPWPLLLLLAMSPVIYRCGSAIVAPVPQNVQLAVKTCILSLIALDAAVAMLAGGPVWAALILALLIPARLLGRWVYST